jgi:hypothetical protein
VSLSPVHFEVRMIPIAVLLVLLAVFVAEVWLLAR